MTLKRVFAAALVFSAAFLFAMAGLPDRAAHTGSLSPLGLVAAEVGALAPPIVADTLTGERFAGFIRQRVTLVNFWATWCAPCRAEMQELQALHEAHSDTLHVVGVNLAEDPATIRAWTQAHGITYDMIPDIDQAISRAYRVRAQPMTVLIDGNGRVQRVIFGVTTAERLLADIRRIQGQ